MISKLVFYSHRIRGTFISMSPSFEASPRSGRRFSPNAILLVVLSFIVVFTGMVVFLSANREAVKWDLSTPQGVVQTYLAAMISGESDRAESMLSKESECTFSEIDRAYVQADSRVYLTSTKILEKNATVNVKVDFPSGGPFTDYYSETHTFRLIRDGSSWRLLGIPWPIYDCGVLQK